MDYRTITDETSDQWELQKKAITDENGLRRIGDHYIVALGTYYSDRCGDVFQIELEGGETFTAIVGDIKADIHTDCSRMYCPMGNGKGNLLEFIVDSDKLREEAIKTGDISYIGFEGDVVRIDKIEELND